MIECGAQATGGIFTDWDTVQDWSDLESVKLCIHTGCFLSKSVGTILGFPLWNVELMDPLLSLSHLEQGVWSIMGLLLSKCVSVSTCLIAVISSLLIVSI